MAYQFSETVHGHATITDDFGDNLLTVKATPKLDGSPGFDVIPTIDRNLAAKIVRALNFYDAVRDVAGDRM